MGTNEMGLILEAEWKLEKKYLNNLSSKNTQSNPLKCVYLHQGNLFTGGGGVGALPLAQLSINLNLIQPCIMKRYVCMTSTQ